MSEVGYHASIAVRHFAAKLGKAYQVIALLNHLWSCAPSPWTLEPKLFVSASRVDWLIASRTGRSDAFRLLIKLGALKKASKPTRSGVAYILLRPALWELAPDLQNLIHNTSPRDYLYNAELDIKVDAALVKAPAYSGAQGRPKVKRKDIRDHLKLLTLGKQKIPVTWKLLAYMLEQICGLSKGAVSWRKAAKDVEALGAWLVTAKIKPSEMNKLFKLLRVERAERPSGNVLRYVFEEDTPEKAEYLRCVLADLRPRLQAAKGDET